MSYSDNDWTPGDFGREIIEQPYRSTEEARRECEMARQALMKVARWAADMGHGELRAKMTVSMEEVGIDSASAKALADGFMRPTSSINNYVNEAAKAVHLLAGKIELFEEMVRDARAQARDTSNGLKVNG